MSIQTLPPADAVVIGGGILGASSAYWLTQLGVRNVVLLEKNGLATGATGKSAGLVRMHYTNPWDAALAYESWKLFSNWSDVVGGDCDFRKTGFLMIVSPDSVDNLHRNVSMLQGIGVNTRTISPREIRELQPMMSLEGVGGAAYEPDSGYADPSSTTTSLAHRAADAGARILQGVAAESIEVQGGAIVGVKTTAGPLATSIVVNATGAWAPFFARELELDLPIRSKRVVEVFVRRPFGAEHMTVIDEAVGTYFRPEGHDLTLVGGSSNDWDVDPDDYDQSVDLSTVTDAISLLVQRIPSLKDAGLLRGVAGIDGFAQDRHLILGRAPGVAGLFLALAGSGAGFKVGPAVGKCIAELIVHGASKTVDINPFRPERFAEGEPVRGQHEYAPMRGLAGARLV